MTNQPEMTLEIDRYLDEACSFLKNSLMYQMSLGSKELFHSNVWGWLLENEKSFIKVFYPDFDLSQYANGTQIWPCREEHHRDLLIWLEKTNGEKSHLVIENKIKSIPTREQLKGYSVQLNDSPFAGGVLTGIGKNCQIDLTGIEGGQWTYIDYSELACRIYRIAQESSAPVIQSHLAQITEYCQIIRCIDRVLADKLKKQENRLCWECDRELSELRIDDVFKKLKLAQFAKFVQERASCLRSPEGFKVRISQWFSNGKSIFDIRYAQDSPGVDEPYRELGIQIEGNQFRLGSQANGHIPKMTTDKAFADYAGSWFDASFDAGRSRTVWGRKTTMKPRNGKQYDSYCVAGSYCYVYQYFDIDQIGDSFEDLFALIDEYMRKACDILENGK